MPNRAGPPPVKQVAPENQKMELVVHALERPDRVTTFQALLGRENFDRWKAVALHALAQNDKVLRNCTEVSIVEAIRESAALNLQPTGLLGEGWILPYGDVAKFQPGYRGYLKLLRNSGQVRVVDCQLVYMEDEFSLRLGTDPAINHVPRLYGEKDAETGEYLEGRGEYRGAYAYVKMNSGELSIEWMTTDDIAAIQRLSPSVRGGRPSPWDEHWGEMARKTVLRRLLKRMPLDTMPAVGKALSHDEEGDAIEGTFTEPPQPVGARASAAAYALAHGAEEAAGEAQGTSEAAVEAATPPPPEPSTELAACNAESPYGDGARCVQPADHVNNHRGPDGSTWN